MRGGGLSQDMETRISFAEWEIKALKEGQARQDDRLLELGSRIDTHHQQVMAAINGLRDEQAKREGAEAERALMRRESDRRMKWIAGIASLLGTFAALGWIGEAKGSMAVTERDMGWERIKAEMDKANDAGVKVGVLGDAGTSDDGADMLLIAAANEFGTSDGRIPPRPFIRGTFDAQQRDLSRTQERLWNLILAGKLDVDRALALMGEEHQGQVQEFMTALDTPPNAPSTIRQKTTSAGVGDSPLIDTGRLRASIRWEKE